MCVTANETLALKSAHSGNAQGLLRGSYDRKTADLEKQLVGVPTHKFVTFRITS